ncbi:hypothetical protein ACFSX9_06305 [Flavobacterium ardleyense]|uniref:Lipoprotein n=1 Tax=Flavobacterium ardleyense TaxID=2038737 RepID=A0ABW5Z8C9_9FLAO
MKKIFIIATMALMIGLQSCKSTEKTAETVETVERDDFRSASKAETARILKEVNAKNANKSVLILTQMYKGEKIQATQAGKVVFSDYPITNLNTRIANYFSISNQADAVIKDINTGQEVVIPTAKAVKYKFIYIMKKVSEGKFKYVVTYSNTLRPLG